MGATIAGTLCVTALIVLFIAFPPVLAWVLAGFGIVILGYAVGQFVRMALGR